ncbi:MAG: alpha,alpha-trehalase TreF [Bacteroidota bacterium]
MKYRLLVLAILVSLSSCFIEVKKTAITEEDLGLYESTLFRDVQTLPVFKDSKTFVDLVPKTSIAELEAKYLLEKDEADFDLKDFVAQNFEDRSMQALAFQTDTTKTMYEHINTMWDKLTRGPDSAVAYSSRIALPFKYVVPGGRFQEIYYWDSYFTMEGLLVTGREDLAEAMVNNFSMLIDSIGFIPNGTRDYYRSRSQPPFYAMMVDAIARKDSTKLLAYLPQLQKEYDFWMATSGEKRSPGEADHHIIHLSDSTVLNRYWDSSNTPRPEAYKEDMHLASHLSEDADKTVLYNHLRSAAASGWDFSSRWYGSKNEFNSTETAHILPVDLNCLLYFLESTLSKAYGLKGEAVNSELYAQKAAQRGEQIGTLFWNAETNFFHDYNFEKKELTIEKTLAACFPLYFGLATNEQAAGVKTVLLDEFLKEGGLLTTLEHSGQQWDAPNGWAPLQWIAVKGLMNYGYEAEAKDIMRRWLTLNEKVYRNTGKMMEKYNVEDMTLLSGGGEYETQDGFGWTNGVALGFQRMLEELNP